MSPAKKDPLLEVRDLWVTFETSAGPLEAVRGANLCVYPGQTVAIVGESGSGKSTLAHSVIGLLPGTGKVTSGEIIFEGEDIAHASRKKMVEVRGARIGMVSQDPMSNLDPVWRIGRQVREALEANGIDPSRSTYQHLAEELAVHVADTEDGRLYLSTKGRAALLAEVASQGIDIEKLEEKLIPGFTTRMEATAFLRQAGVTDAENLAETHVTGGNAKDRVTGLLAEAGLPDAARRARQFPHEFSGGMRQRTLIAMGLAARPALLIADEPTSALDVTVQRQILDHLGNLTKGLDTATLLITHDLGLAAERAEHLVVMYRGEVVESGPSLTILKGPRHPYTQRLVAAAPSLSSRRMRANRITTVVENTHDGEQAPSSASSAVVGVSERKAGGGTGGRPKDLLVIDHLTKEFTIRGRTPGRKAATFKAVDDVSFTVPHGTTVALVGESGSGKSTVANIVLRLLEPTAGRVMFDGGDVAHLRGKDLFNFRHRVQPVFQDPYGSLDPMYSIYRTIEEPLRTHKIGTKKEREAKVRELLDHVALPASTMRRFPNELSGGQRQRVAVARALALDPEVVVCDEAVSALDVLVQAQILELLATLQADLGLTYLFITHDLAVVRKVSDWVCVMQTGKLVEQAATEEVFANPKTEYTQALLDAIPGGSLELALSG